MGVIRFYEDGLLTERLSENQAFTSPDTAFIQPDASSQDAELFVAVERATLATGIDADTTSIEISDTFTPLFGSNIIAKLDAEILLINSHNGQYLDVVRGFLGSTATTHSGGSLIYALYDSTNIFVQARDRTPGSGAAANWYKFALTQGGLDNPDATSYITLGNMDVDQTASVWRRVTVPPSEPYSVYTDVSINYNAFVNVALS